MGKISKVEFVERILQERREKKKRKNDEYLGYRAKRRSQYLHTETRKSKSWRKAKW